MGEENASGFLTKEEWGWSVRNKEVRNLPLIPYDAAFCLEGDHGTVVDFFIVKDEMGNEFAKIGETLTDGMSWQEIEDWYSSDNYPPFGGPFTDAMSPFEWLKLHYAPPKSRN
jgi:hypothetical protein